MNDTSAYNIFLNIAAVGKMGGRPLRVKSVPGLGEARTQNVLKQLETALVLLEKQLDLMKSEKQAHHCDQWIHDRFHFSTHCTRFSNILSTTLNWNRTRRAEHDAGAPGRRNTGHIVCKALDFLKADLQLSLSRDSQRAAQWYNPNSLES